MWNLLSCRSDLRHSQAPGCHGPYNLRRMYGKLISSYLSLFLLPLTCTPILWVHQNSNILLITASDHFQNPCENVWEEFVGTVVAIDAEDRTKDKGSKAFRLWVVCGDSEGFLY